MKCEPKTIDIHGIIGFCGNRMVFLGFAPASLLYNLSFADILNDVTGEGYQRPYNKQHSLDFREYITRQDSSTIPLTFNLRKDLSQAWKLEKKDNGKATLILTKGIRSLAQVDSQHRLGELQDSDISLAFMSFIGLDLREEMAMFTIINSKAKGLSSSLTDYHESNLLNNLATEAPHLYIARKLNEDPKSPWYHLIRYGGETTSGLKRRTSFRMMQKAVYQFLKATNSDYNGLEEKYELILTYWKAIQMVFDLEWKDHRHHLITKGIGLYSLMMLLSDIVKNYPQNATRGENFVSIVGQLKDKIDWHSTGTFANIGGHKGAKDAHRVLKGILNI